MEVKSLTFDIMRYNGHAQFEWEAIIQNLNSKPIKGRIMVSFHNPHVSTIIKQAKRFSILARDIKSIRGKKINVSGKNLDRTWKALAKIRLDD